MVPGTYSECQNCDFLSISVDADLDKREPILRFITKKNPRNNHWGEMKLYLQSQVCLRVEEITLTSCYSFKEKRRCFAKQFPYKIALHREIVWSFLHAMLHSSKKCVDFSKFTRQ